MFAQEMITVEGERSRYYGPDATGGPDIDSGSIRTDNRKSDFYFKLVNAPDIVATAWRQQPRAVKAWVTGYVAGINHYLARTGAHARSEEHTSELQSLMRISYAVFCLKKKKQKTTLHI